MLALNCMLGKNKSKTLYNCNCLSVVVNVYVKDSQLFMIIEGMPIIILCFQILVISVWRENYVSKVCLTYNSQISSYIMFEAI